MNYYEATGSFVDGEEALEKAVAKIEKECNERCEKRIGAYAGTVEETVAGWSKSEVLEWAHKAKEDKQVSPYLYQLVLHSWSKKHPNELQLLDEDEVEALAFAAMLLHLLKK